MKTFNSREIKQQQLKILVYGIPGIGKTSLVKTLPDYCKPIVIDAEGGLLSLSGFDVTSVRLSEDSEGNPVPQTARHRRLGEICVWLNLAETKEKYNTIYLDSLTELAKNFHENAKEESQKDADKKGKELDKFLEFRLLGEGMVKIIKYLRDIPHYHVVMTALEELDEDKETGRRFFGPDLGQGNVVKKTVPGILDELFRLTFDDNGERVLLCQTTARSVCKDRSGKLNATEKPDLSTIFDKINSVKPPVITK